MIEKKGTMKETKNNGQMEEEMKALPKKKCI